MQKHITQVPHRATPLKAGDLVAEQEAAAILGIAERTLRNWRSQRIGPPYRKIGRRIVRYHVADLAAFDCAGIGKDGGA